MPLHPFVSGMLKQLGGRPALSDGTPQDARNMMTAAREVYGEGPKMAEVHYIELPTRSGSIPARLLVPAGDVVGVVVYLHGGGWVIGSIDDFDAVGRELAAASGCAVLLPDYRLAPEAPFPAPLHDCEDALLWAAEQAASRFGAPVPLIVAGDSAGGNLAAVLAQRHHQTTPIALQVLIYPVTDCDFTRPSYSAHGAGLILKSGDMAWFFDHYAPAADWMHPDISPLRADDLAGLPPAVVTLAEYDVLHDEGIAYADAMAAAGVPVTQRVVEGMTHGFIRLHNLCDPARAEVERLGAEIRAACAA